MSDRSYRWEVPYTSRRGQRFPTIRVTFAYLRTTRAFDGLVDSGAERSACSAPVAREAGIDLSLFPERPIRGAGGVTRTRRCPIDISILGYRIATEILVVETNVVLVLLGRHDIFRAFQFGFDERAEVLLVEPY
jgi:hypothetical protein